MYFPFLRGKQFELIALREIKVLIADNQDKISPIIEPVKDSSTLASTLVELAKQNVNFTLIINPSVGDLKKHTDRILEIIKNNLSGYTNYQLGVNIYKGINHLNVIASIKSSGISPLSFSLIHLSEVDIVKKITEDFNAVGKVCYNVLNLAKTGRRYNRNFPSDSLVGLNDYFEAQSRNADYLGIGESRFSEEHLYFKDEGTAGFSDYLTIGSNYSESGFLPYAVAIHLSFVNSDNVIHVRHFVSDSNEDSTDIAGKFAEALDKLIDWCKSTGINSSAIKEFEDLHSRGHFPGLGTLKKLSVKHHIETVLSCL